MSAGRRLLPALIFTVGILSFGLVAYLGYEFGRYQAGYDLLDSRRATEALDATISAQAGTIEGLERQVAILETAREIDAEAYAEVEANLDELENQIVEQQERLRFFQGIVSPEDGEAGLRIQDFEVVADQDPAGYVVRLLLVQAIVHNERVTGSVVLALNGSVDGEPVVLEMAELVDSDIAGGIPYGFRYFQSVEFPLSLPAGFSAESVDVEIVPQSPRGSAWTQSFAWQG
jgi:hypothetical protein